MTDINNVKWAKIIPKKFEKLEESKEFVVKPLSEDNITIFIIKLTPMAGLHKGRTYILEFHTKYQKNGKTYYFPFNPPKVKFISKMFHSNIYGDGDICLDILKDNWSPTYNFDTVLNSIINLLDHPNPNSAANGQAASQEIKFEREYQNYLKTYNIQSEEERDLIKLDIYSEYIQNMKKHDNLNITIYKKYAKYFE